RLADGVALVAGFRALVRDPVAVEVAHALGQGACIRVVRLDQRCGAGDGPRTGVGARQGDGELLVVQGRILDDLQAAELLGQATGGRVVLILGVYLGLRA